MYSMDNNQERQESQKDDIYKEKCEIEEIPDIHTKETNAKANHNN